MRIFPHERVGEQGVLAMGMVDVIGTMKMMYYLKEMLWNIGLYSKVRKDYRCYSGKV